MMYHVCFFFNCPQMLNNIHVIENVMKATTKRNNNNSNNNNYTTTTKKEEKQPLV